MKIMGNPVLLRAGIVFVCSTFAFLMGLIFIRLLRKSITEDADISSEGAPSLETLPQHLYTTVIQQLKQQKHELLVQSQAEQARLKTTETLSQAVLSNLPCGVLVFGTNGLIKTSNPAAKSILGFASTTGMGAEDIFRGAEIHRHEKSSSEPSESGVFPDEAIDERVRLADEVDAVLHELSEHRQVEAEYETPAGEQRFLAVTISQVVAPEGTMLGVACLINDLSELEQIRRQQELRGEISAEMALQLRTSLTTISGYAQQLAGNRDPELAKQLSSDIAEEAAQLDRNLGGFLTEKRATPAAASGD
jgi:nitrogen fixation/metabolism regulation signal transduction histidine kinase